MASGRLEQQMMIAARICAGLGTVLNWSGKRFKPTDFLPNKSKPIKIDQERAFNLLTRAYVK